MTSFEGGSNIGDFSKDLPKTFDQMIEDMLQCEQTLNQSVYQHGQSVTDNVSLIRKHLCGEIFLSPELWRLPKCFESHGKELLEKMFDQETSNLYSLYHDCGKPYCLKIDSETGKRHFPNHAEISGHVWESLTGNMVVGKLIRNDMVFHLCTASDLADKLDNDWTVQEAVTLFVTAVAEIHSNARMFGGIDSVSFKIKQKQLDKRGNQLCKHIFSQVN